MVRSGRPQRAVGAGTTTSDDLNNATSSKPKAFVTMPFGESDEDKEMFQTTYNFSKEKLEAFGFEVRRADETPGSSSIMRQIIQHIDESDVCVADLTGSNANVFYELAIAHSLDKPVILMTQDDVRDLPFDIASYRVYQYSDSIAGSGEVEDALRIGATAFLQGNPIFGNPVSEYFGREVRRFSPENSEEAEPGLYDYFDQLERSQGSILGIYGKFRSGQDDMLARMQNVTGRFQQARSAHQRILLLRGFAADVDESASQMEADSRAYRDEIDWQEIALEAVLHQVDLDIEDNLSGYLVIVGHLRDLDVNMANLRGALNSYAATLDGLPNVESRFNRAVGNMKDGVSYMSVLVECHRAVLLRSRKISDARLRSIGISE